MAAWYFVSVSEKVIHMTEEIQLPRVQKMLLSLAENFPKERYQVLLIELSKPAKTPCLSWYKNHHSCNKI